MVGSAEQPPASASRVVIRETPDGLGIYNPAERNISLVGFLLLWLAVWCVGEVLAIYEMLRPGNLLASAFLLVWLIVWTLGGVLALWTLLWQFLGSERLFITGGALVRSAGLAFLRRRSIHALDEVRNIRIETLPEQESRQKLPRRAILFDAREGTFRFGTGLGEQDLRAALAAILHHMPPGADATVADETGRE